MGNLATGSQTRNMAEVLGYKYPSDDRFRCATAPLALCRGSPDDPVADRFRDSLRPIAHAESGAGVQDIVVDRSL
jgi:hypothetical protein